MPVTFGDLTIRGRCLLAAGFAAALCALLLDERDLLRIAAFVVVLPLLALAAGWTGRGVRADRQIVPPRITAGSSCEVRLEVRSTSWLGGGLLLEERSSPALGKARRFVVEWLPRKGAARLHYPLDPVHRGVHLLGPLINRITDPFGLVESHREIAGHSRLVVPPVVVPLIGMPTGAERDSGHGRAGAGRHDSHGLLGEDAVVVRHYQHGDELRKVHWRSTARHDELMVRTEEQPGRGVTAVLLDHRGAAHRGSGPTSSLEYAVSLAASICRHLQRQGLRVRLVTADGRVLGEATDQADYHTDIALAALEPTAASELGCGPTLSEAHEVIAVLGSTSPAGVAQLRQCRRTGVPGHAVLLDVAAWDVAQSRNPTGTAPDPTATARTLVTAGWSVTVAAPGQPIGSVWEQLCLSSRNGPGAVR